MQIFVKGIDGKTVVVHVDPSTDTVEGLKAKLEELVGFPAPMQRIIFNGKQLADGHKLSDYSVYESATMHLAGRLLSCGGRCPSCCGGGGDSDSDTIYIYVQTRTSKTMALQVEPSDTVTRVMEKISGHQSLFLAGNKLKDDRTFRYYYQEKIIQNDSTLHLDFGTQIFVKTLSGKNVTLEVEPSDTVGDVTAKIQDHQQKIMFQGRRLNKKRKLSFYGVQNHSTLHVDLCRRRRPHGRSMQIAVKTVARRSNNAMRFKVKLADRIGDLKAKIQDQQRLLFEGQQLLDDGQMTLANYNVKAKSTMRLDCPMEIFVKTSAGRTITLEVQPSHTVDAVKRTIGGAHQSLSLTFDGNKLDDGKTLAECNVHMGCTLHLC